ncbi:MAG: hypothetical protein M1826_003917 [Phylliscum demangeonii]|nr:MAG: hypothetical protein M1826_003917 [Phylliscum demangeonii]
MQNTQDKQEVRERMLAHFDGTPLSKIGAKWDQLYQDGHFLPWDRQKPNPALEDLLNDRHHLLGSVWVDDEGGRRRRRALVPGCGIGYDVLLLSSFGFDAYGLEISASALEKSKEFARTHAGDYPPRTEAGPGSVTFLLGDFFEDNWRQEVKGGGSFELCYDYTFFCALSPSMRPVWALRYYRLLADHPSSRLLCLEFPTAKPPATKGPPFGVSSAVYVAQLEHPGQELPYDDEGNLLVDQLHPSSPIGLERVAHWQPERTHEIGKGTDWVSVWRRKTLAG